MRFGLFIMGTRRGSYQAVLEQVCQAEQLGFDTVILAERHFQHADLLFPSPLSFGAAIAARTSRIRIATAARILPLAHPIHIAEDAATLDVISNGRLEFGVARASLDEQAHDAFRSPLDESRQRFEEALEIILRAWTHESVSYDGKCYQIPQVSVSPKPLQKPHPPVYVVAVSPQTVAFAGRSGHCVYLPGTRTLSELASDLAALLEAPTSGRIQRRAGRLVHQSLHLRQRRRPIRPQADRRAVPGIHRPARAGPQSRAA